MVGLRFSYSIVSNPTLKSSDRGYCSTRDSARDRTRCGDSRTSAATYGILGIAIPRLQKQREDAVRAEISTLTLYYRVDIPAGVTTASPDINPATPEDLENHRKVEKVVNNTKYQPQNDHAESCHGINQPDECGQHLGDDSQKTFRALICSYVVTSCGLNLRGSCRIMHAFSPQPSQAYGQQALGRIRKVGQKHVVWLFTYYVVGTFNEVMKGKIMDKFLPLLVADLNSSFFEVDDDSCEEDGKNDVQGGEKVVGGWVRNGDTVIPYSVAKAKGVDLSQTQRLDAMDASRARYEVLKGSEKTLPESNGNVEAEADTEEEPVFDLSDDINEKAEDRFVSPDFEASDCSGREDSAFDAEDVDLDEIRQLVYKTKSSERETGSDVESDVLLIQGTRFSRGQMQDLWKTMESYSFRVSYLTRMHISGWLRQKEIEEFLSVLNRHSLSIYIRRPCLM